MNTRFNNINCSLKSHYISIHSEDRNNIKYPNANYFEISLPENIKKIKSVCLKHWNFGCVDISNNTTIYMEIDRLNFIDEIEPFRNNNASNISNTNQLNSRVNASFAKIVIPSINMYDNYGVCKSFDPPLLSLNTMKFKFRYHNGNMVDFKNSDFSFTLEFFIVN